MPLQMASGKLFHSAPTHTNELRGVLYSNLYPLDPIRTNAGSLVPTQDPSQRTLVYELEEHMEGPKEAGVIVSRGIRPYLSDFAVITAFGLNVVCTPDPDLLRRLLVGPPSPTTGVMPQQLASAPFQELVTCTQSQAEQFADFVNQLMGLRRKVFLDAMRAIRTYVTGVYRLGDDPNASYTLLLSSLEPLLRHFSVQDPTWQEYPANKRRPLDEALKAADEGTRRDVQKALLELDKNAIGRRFRLFIDAHLEASFFRAEASGTVSPIGRSGLPRSLGHAYALRSSYLHASKGLPQELTLAPMRRAETIQVVGRGTVLTFEGLSRLVRHVIRRFIACQEPLEKEPYDYSGEEPGVMKVQLAPQYWLDRPGDFSAKDGRKRLFGFCGQLASGLEGGDTAPISDLRGVLEEALGRFAHMKPKDRLPFLVLHRLYGLAAPEDYRVNGNIDVLGLYKEEMDSPSIEAALLSMLVESVPSWPLTEHEAVLRAYFEGSDRDRGLGVYKLLEVGMTLELAERFRRAGDEEKARKLVGFALENDPGNESLMRFEREFDPCEPIRWLDVMGLPVQESDEDGVEEVVC